MQANITDRNGRGRSEVRYNIEAIIKEFVGG
jgi:hypothetical protein